MEKTLKTIWVSPKVAWDRASVNHTQPVLARLSLSYGTHLPALSEKNALKEQCSLPAFLSEKFLLPSSFLMMDYLVFPSMSLVPFKLSALLKVSLVRKKEIGH